MSLTTAKRRPAILGSRPGNATETRSITGSPSPVRMPSPTVVSAPTPATAAAVRPRNNRLPTRSGAAGPGAAGSGAGAATSGAAAAGSGGPATDPTLTWDAGDTEDAAGSTTATTTGRADLRSSSAATALGISSATRKITR
jgi:hypothetical protein